MVEIVVDDQSQDIAYLCNVTKQTVSGTYFNNTWTSTSEDECQHGWFKHTFYGTGVRIAASTPQANASYSVKLDNGPWITQQGKGYYESPVLDDGQHTISYATGQLDILRTFDYLTVTAGPSTPFLNRTVIVDDTDPSLIYNGNWTSQNSRVVPSSETSPFQDTTHWSTTAGDSIQFQFNGNSIAIFGAFTDIKDGHNFSATYSIDGVASTHSIPNGTLEGLPLAQLFHADVPAGHHTLVINVTHIAPPLAVGFDVITYNASFANISSTPGYVIPPPRNSSHGASAGAIAGGTIGGIAFIAIVVLIGLFLRQRRQSRQIEDQRKRDQAWSELK